MEKTQYLKELNELKVSKEREQFKQKYFAEQFKFLPKSEVKTNLINFHEIVLPEIIQPSTTRRTVPPARCRNNLLFQTTG